MTDRHRIDVLIRQGLIKAYIRRVAEEIDEYYRVLGVTKVILLGVLTGAFVFMSELIQELEDINGVRFRQGNGRIWWLVDFIDMESYKPNGKGTMSSSGEILLRRDSKMQLKEERVLIVEDIADTCRSLDWLLSHVRSRGCRDCNVVVMLRKPCAQVDVPIQFVAQEIPNEFVVGMGLDWNGLYRGLPYIGVIIPEQETSLKT